MADISTYFHNIYKDLISFSYALIPDQLQSHQVVMDALSVFLVQEKKLIEKFFVQDETSFDFHRFRMKRTLYKYIFKIAKKRSDQLENSIMAGERFSAFFALSLEERGVLFFKYKTNFDFSDIQEVTESTSTRTISNLQVGRKKLLNNLGLEEVQ